MVVDVASGRNCRLGARSKHGFVPSRHFIGFSVFSGYVGWLVPRRALNDATLIRVRVVAYFDRLRRVIVLGVMGDYNITIATWPTPIPMMTVC